MYARTTSRPKRRILPGHARTRSSRASADATPLPGADPVRHRRQRLAWGSNQARRFDRAEVTNRFTVGIALAVMMLVVLSTFNGVTNPLERAHNAQADAASMTPDTAQVESRIQPA